MRGLSGAFVESMSDLMERKRTGDLAWNGACPGCGGSADEAYGRECLRCRDCTSIWAPQRRAYDYNDAYPTSRSHDDEVVAACEIRTLEVWSNHLEVGPASRLATLNKLTGAGARALLVLSLADCLSRKLPRPLWPHDIADHWVFYSTSGLTRLWRHHGWTLLATFHPRKCLSALSIARHRKLKTGLKLPIVPPRGPTFWFNFGERGLVFEKTLT